MIACNHCGALRAVQGELLIDGHVTAQLYHAMPIDVQGELLIDGTASITSPWFHIDVQGELLIDGTASITYSPPPPPPPPL